MTPAVVSASVEDNLTDVERILTEHRVSCLPVLGRDGRVAGVISHTDLLQIGHVMARTVGGKELLRLPAMCAGDLMTARVIAATPELTVAQAARLMRDGNVQRLFILEDGQAVGVMSTRDVMAAIFEARVAAPLGRFMTAPALTIDAAAAVSEAADRLYGSRATGLVVMAGGAPAGIFTQIEAVAAREQPRTRPVGEVVGYSLICLPEETPVWRAAGFACETRARRVLAFAQGGLAGILTGLNFAGAALA